MREVASPQAKTEGVSYRKKYTPPVSYADIPLKTRGTRIDVELNSTRPAVNGSSH